MMKATETEPKGISMNYSQNRFARSLFVLAIAFLAHSFACFAADDPLVAGFENPPVSAKPQTWWHWMNGNITREGITADLEAMHRVGISEANIITVASGIPPGPVPVMSPQFFDMVEYAAKEADRLGMTLCMDNCPGWSNSGGPWVTPEHAMQFVTTSETVAQGPSQFSAKLAQPPAKNGFYRDIALLAFRTPAAGEETVTPDNPAKITSNAPGVDPTSLLEHGSNKLVRLPVPAAHNPCFVQIDFSKPIKARTLIITAGAMAPAGGKILASEDGASFHIRRGEQFPASV